MSRLTPLTMLAACLVTLLHGAAAAHTDLQSTVPEADSSVADPPVEVVLVFSAALQPGSTPDVRVIDPAGDDLVSAPPTLDGATVTVPLNLAVAPGEHRVDWAITAADGDDQTGGFTFTFAPTVVPEPAGGPTSPTPPTAQPTVTDAEPGASTEPVATEPDPVETEDPEETETALVQADDGASSTMTRALVVVAAFFAVAGVGAVMLTRGRRDGSA